MNHENRPANEPTNDPENEFEAMEFETLEFDQRLDEVEQRLRRARPQPPRLDAAAVIRLMDETNVAQPPPAVEKHVAQPPPAVEKHVAQPPSAVKNHPATAALASAEPSTIQGQPRAAILHAYRRLATVAASWTCGAVVGALVMFLAIDRSHPAGLVPAGEAVRAEQQTLSTDQDSMVADREAASRPSETAGQRVARERTADVLGWIAESGRHERSDEPEFRAGMHLVQNNVPRRREGRPYFETSRFDDAMDEEVGSRPSEPPMTRERLLEELLKQTAGHVL